MLVLGVLAQRQRQSALEQEREQACHQPTYRLASSMTTNLSHRQREAPRDLALKHGVDLIEVRACVRASALPCALVSGRLCVGGLCVGCRLTVAK
jgi:hypothetical protein